MIAVVIIFILLCAACVLAVTALHLTVVNRHLRSHLVRYRRELSRLYGTSESLLRKNEELKNSVDSGDRWKIS